MHSSVLQEVIVILDTIVVGSIDVNCYIIACAETGEAVVIDPGDDAEIILQRINSKKLTIRHILLTHGHFDHIGAVAALQRATGAQVHAHQDDLDLIRQDPAQAAYFALPSTEPFTVDSFVSDGDEIVWGALAAKVLATPGHSRGSVCYLIDRDVFVGDTLFSRSIGRTDLFGGDYDQLQESIREKLLTLPDETTVYSGHGPKTTIGREKKHNPFIT
jgi:hydroxyacylglutathione hydrolase